MDRHLPPLGVVALVRNAVAHHVDQVAPAHQLQTRLAVAWEQDVVVAQRHALRNRDRLLAQRLHVERELAGALQCLHTVVVDAQQQHVAQPGAQHLGFQPGVPVAHRAVLVVEHAHQRERQLAHIGRVAVDRWFQRFARLRQLQLAEVGLLTRPRRRFRHV